MTLQASGAISLANVNTELGVASTTTRSMNDAALRTLFGVGSGAISMSHGYGKSNRVVSNITISANTLSYVLNTAKVTGYAAGRTDVTLTINSGVYVGSTSSPSVPALDVDTSWAAGDTIHIIVSSGAYIAGVGGNGGFGGSINYGNGNVAYGGNGSAGGPALRVQRPVSITNNGTIQGGGGGGGGAGMSTAGKGSYLGGNGGGGAGWNVGAGYGWLQMNAEYWLVPAANGTLTAGGAGASGGTLSGYGGPNNNPGNTGGSGGAPGAAGGAGATTAGGTTSGNGSGGAGGNCTMSGSNANITWLATGTRTGTIG